MSYDKSNQTKFDLNLGFFFFLNLEIFEKIIYTFISFGCSVAFNMGKLIFTLSINKKKNLILTLKMYLKMCTEVNLWHYPSDFMKLWVSWWKLEKRYNGDTASKFNYFVS